MEENKTNLENNEATNNINVANNASNEIEAPGTTLGVNPPSDNVNTINNETNNNQVKPKNNKKKIIIIVSIIVGVILLAIIAMFIYVKVAFKAGKYLDKKLDEFTTSVTEVFSALNMNNNQDIRYSGTFKPTSNIATFEGLNNATIEFDALYSLTNNIVDINFDLLNGTTSTLNGELYIDNETFVLDSTLYENPLYMDIDNSSEISNEELMNIISDAEYFVNGFATYFVEALKDTTLTTEIAGLTAKYTYTIDDTNKEAFASRMNELINSDERFKELLEEFLGETNPEVNPENIDDFTFYVETSIPSGDVKIFFLVIDDETIFSGEELESGTFRLYAGEEQLADITTNGDEITFKMDMDNEGSIDIIYNENTKEINGTITFDTATLKIGSTKDNDNMLYIISLEDTSSDVFMEISADTSDTVITGYILIKSGEEEIRLDYDINIEYGSNLVSNKTFDNAQNIEYLTEAEQGQIEENLMTAIEPFFTELIESTAKDAFMSDAYEIFNGAQSFFIRESFISDTTLLPNEGDSMCVTIAELENEYYVYLNNSYRGKVDITRVNNTYEYRLTMSDGNYMVINQTENSISTDSITTYNESFTSSEVCLNN